MRYFLSKQQKQIPISDGVQILLANRGKLCPMEVDLTSPIPCSRSLSFHITLSVIFRCFFFSLSAACSFFKCHRCNFKSCYTCRTPSHPAMTCAQYQSHISPPDPRTKKYLAENTMVCHGCKRWCQKTEGCDHMTCKCGHEWCWRCGASYQGIRREGNHMHNKGCIHYREYIRRQNSHFP